MGYKQNKQGFTLLELSIVLVIIGLIIGGITVGQDMIRSAEVNSIISDIKKYKTVLNTFKLKYNATPGDMDNATAYWGDDAANCADAGIPDGTPGTCNGNGDGRLSLVVPAMIPEMMLGWQHLGLAEMLPGSYGGMTMTVDVGTNIPAAAIQPGGYLISVNANLPPYHGGNWLLVAAGTNAISFANTSAIPVTDTIAIDQKIDDGKAGLGDMYGYSSASIGAGAPADNHCVLPHQNSDIVANPPTIDYHFAGSGLCTIYIKLKKL